MVPGCIRKQSWVNVNQCVTQQSVYATTEQFISPTDLAHDDNPSISKSLDQKMCVVQVHVQTFKVN